MLFLAVILSFFATVLLLPVLIKVVTALNILDTPEKRKVHTIETPAMGGIAIFIGLSISALFVLPYDLLVDFKYLYIGLIITFLLGLRDDFSSLQAKQKLLIQTVAAFLVVYFAEVRIESFYGIFGIHELPLYFSVGLTVFTIVGFSNAFNLIDGIDGLAGSVTLLVSMFLSFWFYSTGNILYMVLCFGLASSISAFLLYNWFPSRIFMGDTGSIFIGFFLSIATIKFITENGALIDSASQFSFPAFVGLSVAILIVPLYDTARVATLRLMAGTSPFVPDKKHIHHVLIKQGFTHSQSSLILVTFNLFMIVLAVALQSIGNFGLIIILALSSTLFGMFFDMRLMRYMKAQRMAARNVRKMYISKSA